MNDTREIPLTQGKVALVDAEDYEGLIGWKWHTKHGGAGTYYASRAMGKGPDRRTVRMHREIMNVPEDKDTDHVNHDGLDNRKANLRICTRSQNSQNRRALRGKKYKGICYRVKRNSWRAYIKHNGVWIHLGYFEREDVAARAYDTAAKRFFGEYACLNFSDKAVVS